MTKFSGSTSSLEFDDHREPLQIEGGAAYADRDRAGEHLTVQTFPSALLRYGLTDGFELRLGVPGILIEETDSVSANGRESGLVDATLGFKVKISEGQGPVPQVAFVGTLLIPSGDDEFSGDRIDPAFRFAFSNVLGERVGLTYNLGMFWLTDRSTSDAPDTRSFLDWAVTAGFSATDRLGVFAEMYGVIAVSAENRPLSATGGGVTYLVTHRRVAGRPTV